MNLKQPQSDDISKALDLATSVLAYARFDDTIADLQVRARSELPDLVHIFSYFARKCIERAELSNGNAPIIDNPTFIQIADWTTPHCSKSFLWVCNRIIHSVGFDLIGNCNIQVHKDRVVITELSITQTQVVRFRSDKDKQGDWHYLDLHRFVRTFVNDVVPTIVASAA